jgi:protein-S-isoprenylcysteine O-methyltransferase Ste14
METVAQNQDLAWYRGFIQGKTRIVLAWMFALCLVFTARDYPQWPGILLCLMGALLRFWASGFLRKDTRPAVGGPYALVRNPLYLGTYLMALGVILAIENWALLVVSSVLFAAVYHFIILDEEVKLQKLFQKSYSLYCQSVPRFFPRLWPLSAAKKEVLYKINSEPLHHRFSFKLAMENKAYEALASFLGLIALEILLAFFWK